MYSELDSLETKLGPQIKAMYPDEYDYGIEPFMDCSTAYHFLSAAQYPFSIYLETNRIRRRALDREKEELNCPPIEVAVELDGADENHIMSDDIFWFIEKAYWDAAYCINSKYWYSLARLYYYDRYGHVDLEKAAKILQIAVQDGDGRAEVLLGKCYLLGEGVPQDHEKAFHLLVKGAVLNFYGEAVYLLGDMYMNGWYVIKDKPQAYQMYLRAHRLLNNTDDKDYAVADVSLRLADYCLKEIADKEHILKALDYYQRAELYYLEQEEYHVRGAKDGLVLAVQGQTCAREKLTKLSAQKSAQ